MEFRLLTQHLTKIKDRPCQGLKALPLHERPRERLERDGIDALSHTELIAIVLGNGTEGKSVLELARELLECFGGIEKLLDASIVELMQIKGIGRAKAIVLKAVFGLALKCRKPFKAEKYTIFFSKRRLRFGPGRDCAPSPRGLVCHFTGCARNVFILKKCPWARSQRCSFILARSFTLRSVIKLIV